MKIAFDAKRGFHNSRGLGNYSRDLFRLLATYYPECRQYLFNPSPSKNHLMDLCECQTEIRPSSVLGKSFPSLWRSAGLCRQLKELAPDIYHGLSQELPIGIQHTGVKTVVTMHDAIFVRYPELYPSTYRTLFVQKNKHACHHADRIIAISEQTKRDMIEFFDADESKIDVVYQGCSHLFKNKISDESILEVRAKYQLPQTFILNVGAIEKRKNVGLIIDALHRNKLDIPLVVVGKPSSYLAVLQDKIQAYQMEQQVLFVHSVETKDLPALYAMATIFVYPSIFEGFGIPILEALNTKTPVISSKGSCFEETGGPDTVYVHPEDADELGAALDKLLSDQAAREQMSAKGLRYAEKFSDENIAQHLMQVYRSL